MSTYDVEEFVTICADEMRMAKAQLIDMYSDNKIKRDAALNNLLSEQPSRAAHIEYVLLLEEWIELREKTIMENRINIVGEENLSKYLKTIESDEDARCCFNDIDIIIAQNIETSRVGQDQCFKIMYDLDMKIMLDRTAATLIDEAATFVKKCQKDGLVFKIVNFFLKRCEGYSVGESVSEYSAGESVSEHMSLFANDVIKLFIDDIIQWHFTQQEKLIQRKYKCGEIRFSVFMESVKECEIIVGDCFWNAVQRLEQIYLQYQDRSKKTQ